MKFSKEEIAFIAEGIEQGIRSDGRDRLVTRPLQLQIGILPHANGSAMLKCGGTRILVGVKAELVQVDPRFPNCGRIEVSCSTATSPLFDGRGEEVSTELTAAMNRLLSDGLPPAVHEALCVAKGQQCWYLYADATVLDFDGSLLDCLSMATYAALANTAIPKIKILEGGEIELLDSPEECTYMNVTEVPVYVTLVQIDRRYILDANAAEELCSSSGLSVGINLSGKFCGSKKTEGRGFHPHQLGQMLQACQELGKQRIQKLDSLIALKKEQRQQEQLLDGQIF